MTVQASLLSCLYERLLHAVFSVFNVSQMTRQRHALGLLVALSGYYTTAIHTPLSISARGYHDMTFALFALRPRKSESNLLMFLIALLPGLSLLQDRAECLFAWFHIVTARSTLVAYRY